MSTELPKPAPGAARSWPGRGKKRRADAAGLLLCWTALACATTTGSAVAPSGSSAPNDVTPSAVAPSSATPASSTASPGSESLPASPRTEPTYLTAPVLERAEFVRAVLDSNPTLEAARHGWRAALARGRQAGGFEDPMLDIGVAPLSVGSSEARFGYEVSVSQKLPWFGKRDLEVEANLAAGDAAKSDYESLKRELALSAVRLYEQAFVASKSLEINAEHVALMRALRDAANAQFAVGRGSAEDALRAEAELTHVEHDSVILASQRSVTLAQMNELLHRSPELPLPPLPVEPGAPSDAALDSASWQRAAAQDRPDIQAAQQRARAEQVRAQRAERESYPDLTLSTSYSSMWDMPQHRWMVGLGLTLPVQASRRDAARDEALARSAQFEAEVARLRDAARTRAFIAVKQLEESRHVLRLFETRLLPVASQQLDAARAGLATAHNGLMSVIEAERNLRRLALEQQQARAEYVQRRAELDYAVGRIAGLDWKEETR